MSGGARAGSGGGGRGDAGDPARRCARGQGAAARPGARRALGGPQRRGAPCSGECRARRFWPLPIVQERAGHPGGGARAQESRMLECSSISSTVHAKTKSQNESSDGRAVERRGGARDGRRRDAYLGSVFRRRPRRHRTTLLRALRSTRAPPSCTLRSRGTDARASAGAPSPRRPRLRRRRRRGTSRRPTFGGVVAPSPSAPEAAPDALRVRSRRTRWPTLTVMTAGGRRSLRRRQRVRDGVGASVGRRGRCRGRRAADVLGREPLVAFVEGDFASTGRRRCTRSAEDHIHRATSARHSGRGGGERRKPGGQHVVVCQRGALATSALSSSTAHVDGASTDRGRAAG